MDISCTQEQQQFRDLVRRWVDAKTPSEWMRALEADGENYPFALWNKIPPKPTCSAGGDHRILRMTPISNEMVRNTIADSPGAPRSF